MLLGIRILSNYVNVNSFDYSDRAEFSAGDTVDIHFQLIDLNKDKPNKGFQPSGRRYVPSSGATLTAALVSLDDGVGFAARAASNPDAGDRSIWKVAVLSTDVVRGTLALAIKLTEGIVVTSGRLAAAVSATNSSDSTCGG